MGIKLYRRPKLENPVLIASWPGIGNIGIIAVDTLRGMLRAEEFGEIEPWDFFYPKRLSVKGGILQDLEFPSNKFYFWRRGSEERGKSPYSTKTGKGDVIIFIGEEQPTDGGRVYAEGGKAYHMASLVLDVAEKFGCQRVYTSGAAVAPIHHTMRPRVWAVPSKEDLIDEVKRYDNTILMSQIEGRGGQGSITGLNGLLLGVAKKRGFEAICIMGEIPIYLQGLPLLYPKASKSVLEVLTHNLGIEIDLGKLDELAEQVAEKIERFYTQIPSEIKEQLEKLKYVTYAKPAEPGPITEEEEKKILGDIDKFFGKGGKED